MVINDTQNNKKKHSEDAAACRYPEPEEVQGGRDAYLLGFPFEDGHTL